MAAGSAGASLFSGKLRPWLLAFSVASLGFAFVQTYVRQRCELRTRRPRTLLLWFSVLMVGGMLAAPRYVSSLLAGRLPAFAAAGELRTFDKRVLVSEFNRASDRPGGSAVAHLTRLSAGGLRSG
ncbi:hypothetical protein SBA3_760029 [Candidatus Sulfopaludibacter sp. SbA3]|nr:hypothetical protein SBA3_760029 [Candidatus Sulfopaludibacter sp. SbA3]